MGITFARMTRGTWIGAAFLIVVLGRHPAMACDTPVYRYAMYRWMPAPYELYYFCDGPLDEAGTRVRDRIQALNGATGPAANLAFTPVDLQQDKELVNIPPDVKEAWTRRSSQQLPWCLLLSPMQQRLLEGAFGADDVDALIDSPARQEIGRLLEEGHAGVYVLVGGEDASATDGAEQVVRHVVADIASGKVPLSAAPNATGDALPAQTIQLGFIKVDPADPAEKWLVQSLLALEPDLPASKEPRLFLIYGRGRALFSSLGKGINRDNLILDVEFISGACSCTVKEQNPGIDLLMRYDWDAVAQALSQKFGSEEGSPYRFSGDALFPELVIPMEGVPSSFTAANAVPSDPPPQSDGAPSSGSVSVPPKTEIAADAIAASARSEDAAERQTSTVASSTPVAIAETASEAPSAKTSQPAPPATVSPASSTSAWGAVLWVGVGLLGALVLLFGATFLVLRPR